MFSVCDVLSLTAAGRMRKREKPVRFAEGEGFPSHRLLLLANAHTRHLYSDSESHNLLAPLPGMERIQYNVILIMDGEINKGTLEI